VSCKPALLLMLSIAYVSCKPALLLMLSIAYVSCKLKMWNIDLCIN
jgi:hypothetical protein